MRFVFTRWALTCAVLLSLIWSAPAFAQVSVLGLKNNLIQFALKQVSTPGSFEINAQSVDEPETGVTRLNNVTIRDGRGVWMEARSFQVRWNSSRLLTGELEIGMLAIDGMRLIRLPDPTEPAELKEPVEISPFSWPRSPITVNIQNLSLTDAEISDAVLPQTLRFSAQGAYRDEGDLQQISLTLAREDAIDGDIEFRSERDFDAGTFNFKLSAAEAAGGVTAALIGLPESSDAKLELSGQGPKDDWKLALNLAAQDVLSAQGQATLSYTEPLLASGSFNVRPGPLLQDPLATLLQGGGNLNFDIQEDENGLVQINQAALTSPALKLRADGAFDRPANQFNLDLQINGEAALATLAPGVDFNGFRFSGRAAGTPESFESRGDVALEGLRTDQVDAGQLRLETILTRQDAKFSLRATGRGNALRLDQIGPKLLPGADLDIAVDYADNIARIQQLRLDSRLLTAGISGQYQVDTGSGLIYLTAGLPNLTPISGAYGLETTGAAQLNGTLELQQNVPRLDMQALATNFTAPKTGFETLNVSVQYDAQIEEPRVNVTGQAAGISLDRLGPDFLPRAALSLVARPQSDRILLDQLQLNSALFAVSAQGRVGLGENADIDIAYALSTPDVTRMARAYNVSASGVAASSGRVTGPFDQLALKGETVLNRFAMEQISLGTVQLNHDLNVANAQVSGTLNAKGERGLAEGLKLDIAFSADAERVSAPSIALDFAGLSARGGTNVALGGAAPLIDGNLALETAQLSTLLRRVSPNLAVESGPARIDLVFKPNARATDLAISANLGETRQGTLTLAGAKLRGDVTDILGKQRLNQMLTLQRLAVGDAVALNSSTASLSGVPNRLDVSLATEGTLQDKPLDLKTTAQITALNTATLNSLTLNWAKAQIALASPATLELDDTPAIRDLDLRLPREGRLSGSAGLVPGGYQGNLALAGLDLGLASLFGYHDLSGIVDGTATFDTRPRQAGAEARLTLRNLRIADPESDSAVLTGNVRLDWDGETADLGATLSGDFEEPVQLSVALPVAAKYGDIPQLSRKAPAQAKITWAGNLDRIWAALPLADDIVSGDTKIDLALTGSLDDPRVSGILTLRNGLYQNLLGGVILSDISIDGSVSGLNELALKARATDAGRGRVTAEGALTFGGANGPYLKFDAKLKDTVLIRRDDVTAQLSGSAGIEGSFTNLTATSDITIDRAIVQLIDTGAPSIPSLGDVFVLGTEQSPAEPPALTQLNLDLKISSPGQIFVRGRGVDSEWKLDLAINGTAEEPRLSGDVRKVRGTFNLLGKLFQLETGVIRFAQRRTPDPDLDLEFVNEQSDITGFIRIKGTATEPELSFASLPALPEEEVLPRILFGQSQQSLSAGQTLTIASGLAALISGQPGPLDVARSALGVDVLQIDPSEDGETTVTIGKTVGDGVFIGAEQNLDTNAGTVKIELDVIKNVVIDAELDQDEGSSIGLTWERDF